MPLTAVTKKNLRDLIFSRVMAITAKTDVSMNGYPLSLPIAEMPNVGGAENCNWRVELALSPEFSDALHAAIVQACKELAGQYRLNLPFRGSSASPCG